MTYDEAQQYEQRYDGQPHGWIQWKGTQVCMDIHCSCGEHSHIDADFTYAVKCPYCGRSYRCNPHIQLLPLTEESERAKVADRCD